MDYSLSGVHADPVTGSVMKRGSYEALMRFPDSAATGRARLQAGPGSFHHRLEFPHATSPIQPGSCSAGPSWNSRTRPQHCGDQSAGVVHGTRRAYGRRARALELPETGGPLGCWARDGGARSRSLRGHAGPRLGLGGEPDFSHGRINRRWDSAPDSGWWTALSASRSGRKWMRALPIRERPTGHDHVRVEPHLAVRARVAGHAALEQRDGGRRERRVEWRSRKPALWFARGFMDGGIAFARAGHRPAGAFGRAEAEAGNTSKLASSGRLALMLRGFGGLSNATPPERSIGLSSLDPTVASTTITCAARAPSRAARRALCAARRRGDARITRCSISWRTSCR